MMVNLTDDESDDDDTRCSSSASKKSNEEWESGILKIRRFLHWNFESLSIFLKKALPSVLPFRSLPLGSFELKFFSTTTVILAFLKFTKCGSL